MLIGLIASLIAGVGIAGSVISKVAVKEEVLNNKGGRKTSIRKMEEDRADITKYIYRFAPLTEIDKSVSTMLSQESFPESVYFDWDSRQFVKDETVKFLTLTEKDEYYKGLIRILDEHSDALRNMDCVKELILNYGDNRITVFDSPLRITNNLLIRMNNKIKNEHKVVKLGLNGERRVNESLKLFKSEFIKLDGARFTDSDGNSVECDNIIISPKGIFILEVKNYGESENYAISIDSTGGWRKVKGNHSEAMSSPVGQNIRHIGVLKSVLREYDIECDVKGIVVIANENVEIDNKSNSTIVRYSNLYEELSKGENILSEEQCNNIFNIISSRLEPDKKYPTPNYNSFMETFRMLIETYSYMFKEINKYITDKDMMFYIGVNNLRQILDNKFQYTHIRAYDCIKLGELKGIENVVVSKDTITKLINKGFVKEGDL